MQVVSVISTKGGVGKTPPLRTSAVSLRTPDCACCYSTSMCSPPCPHTMSWLTARRAVCPELLAFNERDLDQLVSRTIIAGLDLVLSNDHRGELNTLLLHAPDGALAAAASASGAQSPLRPGADRHPGRALGAAGDGGAGLRPRAVTRDPEILAARELRRGTMQLLRRTLHRTGSWASRRRRCICSSDRVHPVSANARLIQQALRDIFQDHADIRVLATDVPP